MDPSRIAGKLIMHRPKPTPAPPVGPEVLFVSSRHAPPGTTPPHDDPRREDEATFRRIISNLGVGVLLVDPEGRIRVCNPAALRLLALREDQVVGRAPLEQSWVVVHEDGTRFRVDELPEMIAIREGRPVLGVFMGVDRPGTPQRVWVLVDAIPHLDRDRRVTEVVCSFSDVTDRKRVEDALLAAEDQLRQALKMEAIGRLAGGVAHDFNNLLTAILGYSDLMISRMSDDDPRRHEAEEIRRAAQRAGALTRQLLAFSRKQVLAPRVLDLHVLVDQLHPMLRRLIGEDVALTVVADPHASPLRADAAQLEQVVMNLVLNARDAMPEGGRLRITTGSVSLNASEAASWGLPPGRYVRLAVADTGHGMDEQTRARIFEPFFTTKEEGKGTGLGLSTVYGIVRQSGGSIQVESVPQRGSTFVVLLPEVPELEVAQGSASLGLRARGNESVLLVEDESSVRRLAHEVLSEAGYRVTATSDPESALQFVSASEEDLDLIVTDVVMPGMNGRQLSELIRIARPRVRTLFVSGYLDDPRLWTEPGRPVPLLQKPFSPETLLERVRGALDLPLAATL
jgi:PAS domain S-box-containing protein